MLTHRFEELGGKPEEGRPIILELVSQINSGKFKFVQSTLII